MNYARKVKELRQKHGFSQEELAQKAGISLRTVQRIEKAETTPQGNTLKKLADALGVPTSEIIDWGLKEDRQFLKALNLSALTLLANGLLGILIPMVLWIAKKYKIKGVDELSKDLINFQITLYVIYFCIFEIYSFAQLGRVVFPPTMNVTFGRLTVHVFLFALLIYGTFIYKVALILYNQKRIHMGKPPKYFPKINFLR